MITSSTPDRARVVDEITAAVLQIVPTLSPSDVRGEKHLRQLGADSVDRVEIITMVLDRLGISEPLASFAGLPDLDAMADLLTDRLAGRPAEGAR